MNSYWTCGVTYLRFILVFCGFHFENNTQIIHQKVTEILVAMFLSEALCH